MNKGDSQLKSLEGFVDAVSNERRWALSCYIPMFNIFSCALTAVHKVNSKFCRFHARQGLVLFGLTAFTILTGLFSQTLSLMLWGIVLLFHIVGVVIVLTKKEVPIPVFGQIASNINEYAIFTLLTGKSPEEI